MTCDVDAGAVERLPRCPHGNEAVVWERYIDFVCVDTEGDCVCSVSATTVDAARRAWSALCGSPQPQAVRVPSEWVAVGKRLPEPDADVLVYVPGEQKTFIGSLADDGEWFADDCWYATNEITHWMPLPAAPQAPEGT